MHLDKLGVDAREVQEVSGGDEGGAEVVKDERVVQMRCHESHVMHYRCVVDYLGILTYGQAREPLCPMCRTPINGEVGEEENDSEIYEDERV